ncbi:hypothetical protein ACFOX0_19860 [Micromonospora zhanjiangensis]|uniref:Uncharacterized protein n=1 Tax=Micromonospora zhanjiangensis TaxID=1522057 RepID=A0ABV8KPZ5_9ACTN
MENARADIDALADRLGWSEDPTRPGRESMAQVLAALRTLGCGTDVEVFLPFARAAEAVVDTEMDLLHTGGSDVRASAVIRGVLFDVMMSLMLRTVRQQRVAERLHRPGQAL